MKINKNSIHFSGIFLTIFILSVSLSCIFSPKTGKKGPQPAGQWEEPTTPRKVVNNLQLSFNLLDIDFFEKCLHDNYYYSCPSDIDSLDIYWSRSEDYQAVKSVMEKCREIIFIPSEISISEEYGKNVPDKPDGATLDYENEHPDEIWYICDYYITMDIFSPELGDFKVQQDMKFKMVEDPATHFFSIIRWIDENPLVQ